MARVQDSSKWLVSHLYRAKFDGVEKLDINGIVSYPEGLCVDRIAKLGQPLLFAEIGETKLVSIFTPTEEYTRWCRARNEALLRKKEEEANPEVVRDDLIRQPIWLCPEFAGVEVTLAVGDAICLPVDVSYSGQSQIGSDRVLFRAMKVTGRRDVRSEDAPEYAIVP